MEIQSNPKDKFPGKKKLLFFSLCWSLLFAIFFSGSSIPGLKSDGVTTPQTYLIYLSSSILLLSSIMCLFLDIKFKFIHRWFSLLFVYISITIAFIISDNTPGLSSVANLGYGNLSPVEIGVRGLVMIICFLLIDRVVIQIYPEAFRNEGKLISRTISISTLILYFIASIYYFSFLI